MTFPILGANSAGAEQYLIDNSLRFNDGDSANLGFTPASTTNRKTFTISTWVKTTTLGETEQDILGAGPSGDQSHIQLHDNRFGIRIYDGSHAVAVYTSALLRDASAWYHLVVSVDTTQVTDSNRVKLYVNGIEQSSVVDFNGSTVIYPSLDEQFNFNNSSYTMYIGRRGHSLNYIFDGYLAEYHFIDGQQLDASSFGEFDEDSGIWKPIRYTGTYGTNGFYLDFENSGSLGADQSGNGNNWTPTNLASTDQVLDTPTNNFSTMNPLIPNPIGTNHTFSEGNLEITGATSISGYAYSTYSLTQGKWYFEFRHLAGTPRVVFGDIDGGSQQGMYFQGTGPGGYVSKMVDNSGTTGVVTWANNDIIGLAFDFDAKSFKVFHNGTEVFDETYTTDVEYFAILSDNSSTRDAEGTFNFGQDSSFAGNETRQNNSDGNGYGDFYYAPPTGFLALCTQNLATELSPTIDDGSQYFNTVLWSGNSVDDRSITGVGFAPDLVSIKSRNLSTNFYWYDTTRGADNQIISNATNAEQTITNKLQAFESDGFQLGTSSEVNASSYTYVGWSWKANGGSTSSNTDGSITSTVQANTTAGFSIITYTGTGASGSVGHGLTKAPEMVICKQRTDAGTAWQTGHTGLTNWTYKLLLNDTVAESVNANVFPSAPTSTVINLGLAGDSNGSGKSQLIYAFHSVEGYSKFGSYTGNGSTDGTFVYTGFRPAWIMIKRTDSGGNDWIVIDTKRFTYNQISSYLRANTSDAETDQYNIDEDIVSNGFKLRGDSGNINASGGTYIYMAFAENPFVSSTAIPVTAR